MDSERVLRSRKRYSCKKSQRFSNLARKRWVKTQTRGIATVNSDAKSEDMESESGIVRNSGVEVSAETSVNVIGLQDGSTETEAEINVSIIEFLHLNNQLSNYC